MDKTLNYQNVSKLSDPQVMELLQKLYPERDLYSISLGWRQSSEFILKARGVNGDVIVGWRGVC